MSVTLVKALLLATLASNLVNAWGPRLQPRLQQPNKLPFLSATAVGNPTAHEVLDERIGAWMPVASITSLAGLGPTRVVLLGTQLVVWQADEKDSNSWSVLPDICTHRLAPLSQGRVDPVTNCLECPYHGWQFEQSGACSKIPQLEPCKGIPSVANSEAYPVRITGDVLWCFFDQQDGLCGAEALPFSFFPEARFPVLNTAANTYTRELPYSFDFLVENFMDPSHIPFAHHGLQGTREDGGPTPMSVLVSNDTHIEVAYEDVVRGKPREGVVSFARPCFYHFRTRETPTATAGENLQPLRDGSEQGDGSDQLQTPVPKEKMVMLMLCVPVEPGKSRLFITSRKFPFPFSALPVWLLHALSSRFVDSDVWLHDAERNALATKPNPLRYVLPTGSDLGCSAFRAWWRDKGMAKSGSLFGEPAAATAGLAPTAAAASTSGFPWISKAEQLDRVAYHTENCAACSRALRTAKKLHRRALPGAALLLLALGNAGSSSTAVPLVKYVTSTKGRVAALALACALRAVAAKAIRAIGGPGAAGSELPRRSEAAE
mmetsp:Transcript_36903/g.67522  ORF Transcript_36903/g.67522 Transcript_36903/m.67522 type:complete len:546 (-) Transcript_36903:302-1939(-)